MSNEYQYQLGRIEFSPIRRMHEDRVEDGCIVGCYGCLAVIAVALVYFVYMGL